MSTDPTDFARAYFVNITSSPSIVSVDRSIGSTPRLRRIYMPNTAKDLAGRSRHRTTTQDSPRPPHHHSLLATK